MPIEEALETSSPSILFSQKEGIEETDTNRSEYQRNVLETKQDEALG